MPPKIAQSNHQSLGSSRREQRGVALWESSTRRTTKLRREPANWNGYHLTSGDVARLLEVDLKTVHNWVSRGHVHGRRTEGRHLRFTRTEIVSFMRRFGYPVPSFVGRAPPRVVLDVGSPLLRTTRRKLVRGCELTPCDGLFACSMVLAGGEHEVALIDLEYHRRVLVSEFVSAVRAWDAAKQVCLIGVSPNLAARTHFIRAGGTAAFDSSRSSELRTLLQWLVGSGARQPKGVGEPFL